MSGLAKRMLSKHVLTTAHRPHSVWFPTMSLAIEYKQKVPHNASIKRWGHISRSRAMQNGQYENDVSQTSPAQFGFLV